MWRRLLAGLLIVTALSCGDGDEGAGDDGEDAASSTTAEGAADGAAGTVAEVGEPAPDVSWFTFDGGSASLADYDGRPVVVNFWASWCPPCITEMPAFEEVHQDLGDEVAFLGIAVQETAADSEAFLEDVEVTWDLGRDPDGNVIRRLGGVGMPTTVLIDADGIVQEIHTGELSKEELSDLIDEKIR